VWSQTIGFYIKTLNNPIAKNQGLPPLQETSPQAKLLCASSTPHAAGLATTSSWRLNWLLNQFPSSHNLYIHTFSQLREMHNEEHKKFFIFRFNTEKVLVEALTTLHKNQRDFHTCYYHVWEHESMGYRIKLQGPLILVVLRVWSSIILLCVAYWMLCILPFITYFAQKMKPEPSVQSTFVNLFNTFWMKICRQTLWSCLG
jgi:hypothetical protein